MHTGLARAASTAAWLGVPGSLAALAAAETVSDIVVMRSLLSQSAASAAPLRERLVNVVNTYMVHVYGMLAAGSPVSVLQKYGALGFVQEVFGALAVLGDDDLTTAGYVALVVRCGACALSIAFLATTFLLLGAHASAHIVSPGT